LTCRSIYGIFSLWKQENRMSMYRFPKWLELLLELVVLLAKLVLRLS
jgi:hypothetical protein